MTSVAGLGYINCFFVCFYKVLDVQNIGKKIKKRINEHVLCLKKPTFHGFLEYWGGVGGDVSIFSYFYLRKNNEVGV